MNVTSSPNKQQQQQKIKRTATIVFLFFIRFVLFSQIKWHSIWKSLFNFQCFFLMLKHISRINLNVYLLVFEIFTRIFCGTKSSTFSWYLNNILISADYFKNGTHFFHYSRYNIIIIIIIFINIIFYSFTGLGHSLIIFKTTKTKLFPNK